MRNLKITQESALVPRCSVAPTKWGICGLVYHGKTYPLVNYTKSYLKSPFIVDLPINSMVIFHSFLYVDQRVKPATEKSMMITGGPMT